MKIQICVPCYKGIINDELQKVIKTLNNDGLGETGIEFSYSAFADVTPDASRNESICSSNLLHPELSDANAYLLLDADMEPTLDQIELLIEEFINQHTPVLGAVYQRNNVSSPQKEYCVQIQPGPSEKRKWNGIIPVYTMGFGCALVDAEVLKAIPKPWFNDSWETDGKSYYRRVPGDENFCKKVRGIGLQVCCHFGIEVKHDVVPVDELNKRMGLEDSEILTQGGRSATGN